MVTTTWLLRWYHQSKRRPCGSCIIMLVWLQGMHSSLWKTRSCWRRQLGGIFSAEHGATNGSCHHFWPGGSNDAENAQHFWGIFLKNFIVHESEGSLGWQYNDTCFKGIPPNWTNRGRNPTAFPRDSVDMFVENLREADADSIYDSFKSSNDAA